eukprot:1146916-Pelagomonas_calceolata.AAC.1
MIFSQVVRVLTVFCQGISIPHVYTPLSLFLIPTREIVALTIVYLERTKPPKPPEPPKQPKPPKPG